MNLANVINCGNILLSECFQTIHLELLRGWPVSGGFGFIRLMVLALQLLYPKEYLAEAGNIGVLSAFQNIFILALMNVTQFGSSVWLQWRCITVMDQRLMLLDP